MAETPHGSNIANPPPLVGTPPTVLGPLPGSQPQTPFPDSRLPGIQPYFDVIFKSFMSQATRAQLADEDYQDRTIEACLKFAIKIIKNFPQMKGTVEMPSGTKIVGR